MSSKYLFIILEVIYSFLLDTSKTHRSCKDTFVSQNNFNRSKRLKSSSIFDNVLTTGCIVCAKCNTSNSSCEKLMGLPGPIPLYNDLLEFSLIGEYIPSTGKVILQYENNCFFLIELYRKIDQNTLSVNIKECYEPEGTCKYVIFEFEAKEFNDSHCINLSLAFYERDKIHVAFSLSCNNFSSAAFDPNNFFKIMGEKCYFKRQETKIEVTFLFKQDDDREIDGVPIILPCSPGGYAVSPQTGRFVTGTNCLKIFNQLERKGTGIEFIIKNIYNNDEDIIFPQRHSKIQRINPIYMWPNETAKSRKLMAYTHDRNKRKENKERTNCMYVQQKDFTLEQIFENNFKLRNITVESELEASYEENLNMNVIVGCEELLKMESLQSHHAINYTVTKSACFVCTKPLCDFNETTCQKMSTFEIPVYNKLFEFGFLGAYFPINSTVQVKVNKDCYFNINITRTPELYSISIQECLQTNTACIDTNAKANDSLITEHYFCTYVALAFHESNKLHYGFSFICDKIAASNLAESEFINITQTECHLNTSSGEMIAYFTVLQGENRSHDGVPIILPCSPGGFAADPLTGRFVTGDLCEFSFWDIIPLNGGIDFIIKVLYEGNEDLLFPIKTQIDSASPVYVKENGLAYSPKEMTPKFVKNTKIENMTRLKCTFKQKPRESSGVIEYESDSKTHSSLSSKVKITEAPENLMKMVRHLHPNILKGARNDKIPKFDYFETITETASSDRSTLRANEIKSAANSISLGDFINNISKAFAILVLRKLIHSKKISCI